MTPAPMTASPLGGGATATVELSVTGMHCGSCSALIEEVLLENPAVVRATVDLEAAQASIVFHPDQVGVYDLCGVIAEAGYEAAPTENPGAVT